nr:hypothetical protein [Candidatus Njordarchaeum guaymaensis]
MKTLNISLENQEYEKLCKVKGSRTWKQLLLSLITPGPETGVDQGDAPNSTFEKNLAT